MFHYLWSVWRAIQLGLGLQPDIVQIATNTPNATWIAFGVVMTAGISVLIGQSVILFANQVQPGRFLMSLVINGLLLVVGWIVWTTAVWAIGMWLFAEDASFVLILRLIGLSYAPLVFGFLILMPYLGPFIQRVLYAWSFIVALQAVKLTFHVGFWHALVAAGIGWLLLAVITATIGRPVVALRNYVWHRLTGTALDASANEVLQQFAIDKSAQAASKGDKS